MAIQTRQPTGKPPWPIMLIAGIEKAGKSYSCAVASSSQLIDRTFWISIGEDDPDEYGQLPGARFEIVVHDGSYKSILGAVQAAVAEPSNPARPNMIVIDSASMIWELLTEEAQRVADARQFNTGQITMELWNKAGNKWKRVIEALRAHNGPVVLTARLNEVTVIVNGKPTKEKTWKPQGHKTLPFDVGVIVEFLARGRAEVTGARSLRHDIPLGERRPIENFTLEDLWVKFGFAEPQNVAPRQHSATAPTEASEGNDPDHWLNRANSASSVDELRALYGEAQAAGASGDVLQSIQGQSARFGAN